jgi:multiple sugar transport system substrate-binding protein
VLPVPPAYDTAPALPARLRGAVQVAGQSYCVPRDLSTLALFYNPALFDRVEAPYPHAGWRWSELRSSAEAVTDAEFGLYGLVLSPDASRLLPFLWQSDTDGVLWSGTDSIAAIEFYVNLRVDGVAADPTALDSTWNGEAFGRGRAAMTIEGSWLIPYLASHFPELAYGVVELPAGPVRRATTAFVSCWTVSASAANPEAAFRLAVHLTTAEANAAWASAAGNLPPGLDQATAWLANNAAFAPFVTTLNDALPWTGPPGFAAAVVAANGALEAAFSGEVEGDAAIDELSARLGDLAAPPPVPTPAP